MQNWVKSGVSCEKMLRRQTDEEAGPFWDDADDEELLLEATEKAERESEQILTSPQDVNPSCAADFSPHSGGCTSRMQLEDSILTCQEKQEQRDGRSLKRKTKEPLRDSYGSSVKRVASNVVTKPDRLISDDNGTSHPQVDADRSRQESIPLNLIRGGYLWVSDLSSQRWCEQQMVYSLTLPTEVVESPAMTAGSNLHLARELEVEDKVTIKVTSSEDIFAIKLMNLLGAIDSFLAGIPVRREIPVFGSPFDNDVFLIGQVDEIRCDPQTFDFDLVEFKTRKSRSLPSKAQKDAHRLQVLIYKRLFDDLVLGKTNKNNVASRLDLQLDKPFGDNLRQQLDESSKSCSNLGELFDHLTATVCSVTCISQCLIEYCYQADSSTIGIEQVEYDEDWLQDELERHLAYWKGGREAVGVEIEEAWKCGHCPFNEVCSWREQKANLYQEKNIANSS